ncbi:hypothetical protein ACJ41O_000268 [Fusarium nematophilum]
MAEAIGLVGSVIAIIQVTAKLASGLDELIQEIRDAPVEILHMKQEIRSLAAVLDSTQELSNRHSLQVEDQALTRSLAEFLELCRGSMQDIHVFLEPLVEKGLGSRNLMRMIEWRMKRSELRALQGRLNEGKASLTLTIVALNGVLEGKQQNQVKDDLDKIYQKISEFRGSKRGREIRKRLEEDVDADSVDGGWTRLSITTDRDLIMERYLEENPSARDRGSAADAASEDTTEHGTPSDFTKISLSSLRVTDNSPDAIFEAVRSQNKQLVQSLISRGVGTSSRSAQGMTPLHHCAVANDTEIGALLIDDGGAQVNAKDYQLRSPFKLALACDTLQFAELLVRRGCIVSDSAEEIRQMAARVEEVQARSELFRALSERLGPSEQCFLVHPLIRSGDIKGLGVFIESGFDPMSKDGSGLSLLFYALLHGRRSAITFLTNQGADMNEWLPKSTINELDADLPWRKEMLARTSSGATPLLVAARVMNNEDMTKFVLELGADPNCRNTIVLLGACAPQYLGVAAQMLRAGADPNASGNDARTSMFWTSQLGHARLMRLLIEHGGDVNWRWPQDGSTSLMLAAARGHIDVVRILVNAGADISQSNNKGETALDLARRLKKTKVTAFLEEATLRLG